MTATAADAAAQSPSSIYDIVYDADSPLASEETESGLIHRPRGHGGLTLEEDKFTEDTNGQDSFEGSVDSENEALDPIELPQSTHALFFSEPVFSLPFGYAMAILIISIGSLLLALLDNIGARNIPVNVEPTVKIAQYMAIVIVLLMEEEIPTGLYLLRMIPKQSLNQKFPRMKYRKFVFSTCIRIFLGYFFLLNVLLVLVQATRVLDIFYDVLALQFVQQLDDIAFALAKMDVFGKRLQRACTAKCFRVEFGQNREGRNKNVSRLLKGITGFNFVAMLLAMSYVTMQQESGAKYEEKISVNFGSTLWLDAWAKNLVVENVTEYEQRTVTYSFFNGVYIKNATGDSGRPVYVEARKFDHTFFKKTPPAYFKYCKNINAWVFMHDDIKKSNENSLKSGCQDNWLLRSQETVEFDILSVTGGWQAWVGTVGKSDIDIASDRCEDGTDCNLNGICEDGKCVCYKNNSTRYLGPHCEVTIPMSCETLVGEFFNETWRVKYLRSISEKIWPGDDLETFYSRPVYHLDGPENTTTTLFYLGDRWYSATVPVDPNAVKVDPEDYASFYQEWIPEIHGFWNKLLEDQMVGYISDSTSSSTPVGVDIYEIAGRGEQYGPLGKLKSIQPPGTIGGGYFRCGGPVNKASVVRILKDEVVDRV